MGFNRPTSRQVRSDQQVKQARSDLAKGESEYHSCINAARQLREAPRFLFFVFVIFWLLHLLSACFSLEWRQKPQVKA